MGAPLSPPRKTSVSELRVNQGSRYTCGDPPATSPAPASKPAELARCRVTTHTAPPPLKVRSPTVGPPGRNQTVDLDVSSSRGSGKSPLPTCSGCQQTHSLQVQDQLSAVPRGPRAPPAALRLRCSQPRRALLSLAPVVNYFCLCFALCDFLLSRSWRVALHSFQMNNSGARICIYCKVLPTSPVNTCHLTVTVCFL